MKIKSMKGENGIMSDKIVFSRKELYEEIWDISLSKTALKYNIKSPELKQFCNDNDIPTPSSGYFTRRDWGYDVSGEKTPLSNKDNDEIIFVPKVKKSITKTVIKANKQENNKDEEFAVKETEEAVVKPVIRNYKYQDRLMSLENNFRDKVIEEAQRIEIRTNKKFHKHISTYRNYIDEYNKKEREYKRTYYYARPVYNNLEKPKFFDSVSKDSIPRIERILDALFYSLENVGLKINKDFTIFYGNYDSLNFNFEEKKTKVPHEITKTEAQQLLEYQDNLKQGKYAYKPKINKYDHLFNGNLVITFLGYKISDKKDTTLENQLDDIFISIIECLCSIRTNREKREEEERVRQQEVQRKRDLEKRKELELAKVKELKNEAENFDTAQKIRKYIEAVASMDNLSEEKLEWIKWATEKADWYDPTVSKNDELLGIKDHKKVDKESDSKSYNSNYW